MCVGERELNKISLLIAATSLAALAAGPAAAAELKIGFVKLERLFKEAAPAVKAQKKIEKEFAGRDQEIQKVVKQARDLHHRLYPLCRAAFFETNPIPIKEAMAMMGMLEPEFRLPMCRMADANRERLRGVLKSLGLLKA